MFFLILIIIFVVGLFIYLVRLTDNFKFSKTMLVLSLFSITANISLAQNYNHSLIPGASDGIGISNKIAYWIITDENWGRKWSVESFYKFYNMSSTILILVTIIFVLSLIIESRLNRRVGVGIG